MNNLTTIFNNYLGEANVILTPNRRLAAFLREQYDKTQQTAGLASWPSLNIMPLNSWLKSLWLKRTGSENAWLLLDSFTEKVIWQQFIKAHDLLPETYALIRQWQIDVTKLTPETPEQQKLLDWLQQFTNLCNTKKWLSNNDLPAQLLKLIQKQALALPSKIALIDFEELPPQLTQLVTTLKEQQIKVEFFDTKNKHKAKTRRVSFNSLAEELNHAARWAKALNREHPEHTIGIIVPNLANFREQISEIFQQHFPFAQDLINISLGKPLTYFAPIADAITVLTWLNSEHLEQHKLKQILTSAYFSGYSDNNGTGEKFARAFLAEYSIEAMPPTFSLASWLKFTNSLPKNYFKKHAYATIFLTNLTKAQNLLKQFSPNAKFTIAEFTKLLQDILATLGWPNAIEQKLTYSTIAAINRWQQVFHELLKLEVLNERYSFKQALQLLITKTNKVLFQPQLAASNLTAINILGALEAAGLHFDHLWLMGINHETWPAKANPNPFLPITLQKKLQLPHSSFERELAFSQNLKQRFCQSSNDVIFSFAKTTTEQNQTFLPSPLIKDIEEVALSSIKIATDQDLTTTILQSQKLISIEDWQAPPITPSEKVWKGSKILQLFAACPFRAFASSRLKIPEATTTSIGLNAKERGTFIHAALAIIWQKLVNHNNLIASTEQQLNQLINYALTKASEDFAYERQNLLHNILQLEIKRNQKLLGDWLNQEKQRAPFTVQTLEKRYTIGLAGLNLKMQIDRIDILEDGGAVIIDYKTGKQVATPNAWQTERPDDVQLPLYALAGGEQDKLTITALAYAQINAKNLSFSGLSETENTLPNVKSLAQHKIAYLVTSQDFAELINYFRKLLTKLAEDFVAGNAKVAPKYGNVTCNGCQFRTLCRVEN